MLIFLKILGGGDIPGHPLPLNETLTGLFIQETVKHHLLCFYVI